MKWAFSNRIRVGPKKLQSDEDQQLLFESGDERVGLSVLIGGTFTNADSMTLQGARYESSDTAYAGGRLWRQYMSMAFVIGGIGADFDPLPATSRSYDARPVDPAIPGLVVYPIKQFGYRSEGWFSATTVRPMSRFLEVDLPTVRNAKPNGLEDRNDVELAFRMYRLSLNSDDVDVQYILLVTAIEALIPDAKPIKSDPDVIAAIDELLSYVRDSDKFKKHVRKNLIGTLNRAKEESITNMGSKLSQRITGRTYNGLTPTDYFRRAYRRRSSLVHGGLDKHTGAPVDRGKLSSDVHMLRRFVEDLFALEIGHRAPNGGEPTDD